MQGITADTQRSASGMNREGYSQATERDFRIFRDQHGREYGAVVEKSTNHPCGPITPSYHAPVYPPEHYLVIVDTVRSLVHIDYDRWLHDLEVAWKEYVSEMFAAAVDMYQDKAAEAVEDPPRALVMRVGYPPRFCDRKTGEAVPVIAMAAGNPWMLGVKGAPKPKIAEYYFPAVKATEYLEATEAGVISRKYADPFATETEPSASSEYPLMYAPGRWYLTAEHRASVEAKLEDGFKGSKADALEQLKHSFVGD